MNRDDDDTRIFGVRQATKLDLELTLLALGAARQDVRKIRVPVLRDMIELELGRLALLVPCPECQAPRGRPCLSENLTSHVRRAVLARVEREEQIRDYQIQRKAGV